jgi:hypothetical protein
MAAPSDFVAGALAEASHFRRSKRGDDPTRAGAWSYNPAALVRFTANRSRLRL